MTTLSRSLSPQPLRALSQTWVRRGLVAAIILLISVVASLVLAIGTFPAAWNLGLRGPIDQFEHWVIGNRATHPLFVYGFTPFSDAIDSLLRLCEQFLIELPWATVVLAVALIAYRARGVLLAVLSAVALVMMATVGLWEQSLQTLALMAAAVALALLVGLPLGVLSARWPRVDAVLRPILDTMQTMPAFVYLIPVLLFFGVGRVPAVVATVIYALPPAIRFTASGIRQVPAAAVEAADVFGSTSYQKLMKVQLPLALPAVLAGVNQTIMMALSMVVIAALVGAGGLGRDVLVALQRLNVGQALEAGLAIVLLAVLLDRISAGFYHERQKALMGKGTAAAPKRRILPRWLRNYGYWVGLLLLLWAFTLAASHVTVQGTPIFVTWPEQWRLSIREPVDATVRWMRDHLYQVGDLPIGTGPLSDFFVRSALNPLRAGLVATPWLVIVAAFGVIGYLAAGARLGLFCALAMAVTGFLGLWDATLDTLSQVVVAVALALVIGLPLGIWIAHYNRVRTWMMPVLDLLQTIPVFVYLVPVIMLFNVGRVPGVIASVLYAVPPMIRLTDLGLRQVAPAAVEAADAFGSSPWQRLVKVQLPLAMPSIILGVNQTMMMVLAMVIIAGLVGGGALGFEAVTGLAKSQLGRGIEAGIAIVLLAMMLDRITQAWSRSWVV
jgi:glycine betaine/proline transport system permease protein